MDTSGPFDPAEDYDGGWERLHDDGHGLADLQLGPVHPYDRPDGYQPAHRWGTRHSLTTRSYNDPVGEARPADAEPVALPGGRGSGAGRRGQKGGEVPRAPAAPARNQPGAPVKKGLVVASTRAMAPANTRAAVTAAPAPNRAGATVKKGLVVASTRAMVPASPRAAPAPSRAGATETKAGRRESVALALGITEPELVAVRRAVGGAVAAARGLPKSERNAAVAKRLGWTEEHLFNYFQVESGGPGATSAAARLLVRERSREAAPPATTSAAGRLAPWAVASGPLLAKATPVHGRPEICSACGVAISVSGHCWCST